MAEYRQENPSKAGMGHEDWLNSSSQREWVYVYFRGYFGPRRNVEGRCSQAAWRHGLNYNVIFLEVNGFSNQSLLLNAWLYSPKLINSCCTKCSSYAVQLSGDPPTASPSWRGQSSCPMAPGWFHLWQLLPSHSHLQGGNDVWIHLSNFPFISHLSYSHADADRVLLPLLALPFLVGLYFHPSVLKNTHESILPCVWGVVLTHFCWFAVTLFALALHWCPCFTCCSVSCLFLVIIFPFPTTHPSPAFIWSVCSSPLVFCDSPGPPSEGWTDITVYIFHRWEEFRDTLLCCLTKRWWHRGTAG